MRDVLEPKRTLVSAHLTPDGEAALRAAIKGDGARGHFHRRLLFYIASALGLVLTTWLPWASLKWLDLPTECGVNSGACRGEEEIWYWSYTWISAASGMHTSVPSPSSPRGSVAVAGCDVHS